MTSILEDQLSQIRSFPMKTEVTQLLGIYIYISIMFWGRVVVNQLKTWHVCSLLSGLDLRPCVANEPVVNSLTSKP